MENDLVFTMKLRFVDEQSELSVELIARPHCSRTIGLRRVVRLAQPENTNDTLLGKTKDDVQQTSKKRKRAKQNKRDTFKLRSNISPSKSKKTKHHRKNLFLFLS